MVNERNSLQGNDKLGADMPEKVGWWPVGTVVIGSLAGLCLFGFTFLSNRVDAAQADYQTQIKEIRQETSTQIKDLRAEFLHRFDRIDQKLDSLRNP